MGIFGVICSVVATCVVNVFKEVFSPEKVLEKLNIVKEIIIGVGKLLGIIDTNEEKAEELGNRILQAEEHGIKRGDFSSFEEYKSKIYSLDLDEKLSEKFNIEDKISNALIYYVDKFENKLNVNFGEDKSFLLTVANKPEYFTEDRIASYIKEFSNSDNSIGKVNDFFIGNKMSLKEEIDIEERLCKLEKELNLEKDKEDILKEINDVKNTY
jgi:hypothetical protein